MNVAQMGYNLNRVRTAGGRGPRETSGSHSTPGPSGPRPEPRGPSLSLQPCVEQGATGFRSIPVRVESGQWLSNNAHRMISLEEDRMRHGSTSLPGVGIPFAQEPSHSVARSPWDVQSKRMGGKTAGIAETGAGKRQGAVEPVQPGTSVRGTVGRRPVAPVIHWKDANSRAPDTRRVRGRTVAPEREERPTPCLDDTPFA